MKTILIGCISLIKSIPSDAFEYVTDDITVIAKQTNEATLKYLLEKLNKEEKQLDYYIGVCTPEVFPENCLTRIHIKSEIDKFAGEKGFSLPEFTYLSTDEETSKTTFDVTLSKISEFVRKLGQNDENIEIYLDVAGGRRDNFIFIQLLTKLLSFYGYLVHAYYADITDKNNPTIRNSDLSFRHMEILDAVNEFVTHGNAAGLTKLFERSGSITVKPLLKSLTDLSNSIQLCNLNFDFRLLNQNLEQFEKSTNNSNDVFFIKSMVPLIRKKFHLDDRDSSGVMSIVRWCVENGLVQQAITIYNENIADLIISNNILKVDEKQLDKKSIEKDMNERHQSRKTAIFYQMLSQTVENMKNSSDVISYPKANKGLTFDRVLKNYYGDKDKSKDQQFLIASFYFEEKYLPDGFSVAIDMKLFKKILLDIRFAKTIRNTINHAGNQNVVDTLDKYFNCPGYQYSTFSGSNNFSLKSIIKDMTNVADNFDKAIEQLQQ